MLSISDVLLAGRGVITGPGVISAAVLVCQGVSCCLSDHHSGVIFAVVVVCKQKQQLQLQQQEWRPWGKRCVENNYVIDMVSAQKRIRLCVLKRTPVCVW